MADSVTLKREAVIEAVAAMQAAREFIVSFNGGHESQLDEFLSAEGTKLHEAAFGSIPSPEFESHPAVVDAYVRSYELSAAWLGKLGVRGRVDEELARRMREAGTLEVAEPREGEVIDRRAGGGDAPGRREVPPPHVRDAGADAMSNRELVLELVRELVDTLGQQGVPEGMWLYDIGKAREDLRRLDTVLRRLEVAITSA
jgi:hypothetical protein